MRVRLKLQWSIIVARRIALQGAANAKSKKFIVLLLVMMKDIAAEVPLQLLHIQRRDWQSERVMLEKLILQKVL